MRTVAEIKLEELGKPNEGIIKFDPIFGEVFWR